MKKVLVGTACLFVSVTTAQADSSGVYLRLDSGYSWSEDADLKDSDFANTPAICGNATCTVPGSLSDIGDSYIIGGGVGYRLNSSFRGDVTVLYRGGFGLDDNDNRVPTTFFSGDIDVVSYMASVYWDFPGSFGMFKPYVGAGIGAATIDFENILGNNSNFISGSPDGSQTNFAWQLMAGTSIDLSKNVSLEIGYRYFDAGDFGGDAGPATGALAGLNYNGSEGDLTAHEVTVGLRYDLY